MENKSEVKWSAEKKHYTGGRCRKCNVRYVWRGKPQLKDALCPECGSRLVATTHLFWTCPTVVATPKERR